jgi:hypothetical protein
VAGVDEADARISQRVKGRQIALAGDAEDQLDAVELELIDQDLPARARPRFPALRGAACAWVSGGGGAVLARGSAGGVS